MKTIKSAYRKKALRCHPDKGGSRQEFLKLQEHLGKITVAIGELLRKYPNVKIARKDEEEVNAPAPPTKGTTNTPAWAASPYKTHEGKESLKVLAIKS